MDCQAVSRKHFRGPQVCRGSWHGLPGFEPVAVFWARGPAGLWESHWEEAELGPFRDGAGVALAGSLSLWTIWHSVQLKQWQQEELKQRGRSCHGAASVGCQAVGRHH